MHAHASLTISYTFEHATDDTYLFQEELKVVVELVGTYASSELLSWKIEQIGVERWRAKFNRFVTHWLNNADPFVRLIIAELQASSAFDDRVREVADEMLAEVA